MATNSTTTVLSDGQYHLQIADVFNTLDISGFSVTNSSLLTAVMTLNLLWSAIFIVSFYLLLDTLVYYIPYLAKVPLLPTLKSLLWFTTTVLVAVAIYASGTLLVIKIFGSVVLLLAFIGLVRTFYMMIAMGISYYKHRNFQVALNGPNVAMINGTAVHCDYVPTSVTLAKLNGQLYFNGTHIPGSNLADATVQIYTFNESVTCEPINISRYSRGQYSTFELKSTNTRYELQTYYPKETKTV